MNNEDLFKQFSDDLKEETGELLIPDKCFECNNIEICSIVSMLCGCIKLGIKLQITNCKYYSKSHDTKKINKTDN